jgi:coatomer protein complex subunit gamma
MMQLLDGWLRHKSEMVNFEAAKAICDMRDVTEGELVQAVHVLQLFLTSPRAVTKFAALRILSQMASFKPDAVRSCNQDIESLITNSNRSIATFAITTLLKTGNETSVDRLMKQITGFMAEITDEFKVTIVEAVRTLALKFKAKQSGFLAFLSGILRDEGGYEFKRSVVEAIMDLIRFVPVAKEDALATLCEFIEESCLFLEEKVPQHHNRPSTSDTFITAWFWKTPLFVLQPPRHSPSLVLDKRIPRSRSLSTFSSPVVSTMLTTRFAIVLH